VTHRIIILSGQSNTNGIESSPPGGIPTSSVRFWRRNILTGPADATVQQLKVTTAAEQGGGGAVDIHGCELQLGLDLVAGGWTDLTIVKCARNGSYIRHWADGASQDYFSFLTSTLYGAMPAALAPVFYFIWNQGEAEAQDSDPTFKNEWASKYTTIHTDLETLTGQSLLRLIVRVRSGLSGTYTTEMHDTIQPSVADHLFNVDDLAVLGDNVHLSAASQNTLGSRIASYLLSL